MSSTKRITTVDSSTSFDKVFVNDKNAIKQVSKSDFLTNGGIAKATDMEQAKSDISALYRAVGSPLLASTVAGMTDRNKIYVYTGSETGYVNGNWYYHNGTAWVSGGTYVANPVAVDKTLNVDGAAADAKTVGTEVSALKADLNNMDAGIADLADEVNNASSAIQTINSDVNELQRGGYIADAQQIQEKIDNWLKENPEATTTVQDGSLTEAKFTDALKLKAINDYVTPEMFGAVGDGSNDDVLAIEAAINEAVSKNTYVFLTKRYSISRPIEIKNNTRIFGNIIGRRYDQPIDSTAIVCKNSVPSFFHSDTDIAKIQLLNIALWNNSSVNNVVFDCKINRSDFTIYGYNLQTFSDSLQGCKFINCSFLSTIGTFSNYVSDATFRGCYISGKTSSESPFLTGLMSALIVTGCYFDFWHTVFNPTDATFNVMINNNVFDACYRVFLGKYHQFSVVNNAFMRIKDSALWSLDKDDWAVFANGLRNYTRSIGNKVDADYYIHTSLGGNPYPNHNSYSFGNSLSDTTKIVWNPYPNDATDLLNTRVDELNFKNYETLPSASITSGSTERFNHQIVFSDGVAYINADGEWKSLTLSNEVILSFEATTVPAHSSKNLYDSNAKWKANYYYLCKPAFNLPTSLTYCAYCYTNSVFRIIVSNPTDNDIELPASNWNIRYFPK